MGPFHKERIEGSGSEEQGGLLGNNLPFASNPHCTWDLDEAILSLRCIPALLLQPGRFCVVETNASGLLLSLICNGVEVHFVLPKSTPDPNRGENRVILRFPMLCSPMELEVGIH